MPLTVTANKTALSKFHLNGIEAVRGMAALLVVFFHATSIMSLPKYFATEPLGGFFNFGHAGVDLFFLLSGFIILFVHYDDIGRPQSLKAYVIKRFVRIYPVYWIVSVFVLVVIFLSRPFDTLGWGYIIKSFLLVPQESVYPFVVVAWTLVHEVFFYLVFGVLIFRRFVGVLLMVVWFFGIIITVAAEIEWGYFLAFVFNLHNIGFFLGMMVAFLCLSGKRLPFPVLLSVVGFALFFLTGMSNMHWSQVDSSVFLVAYAFSSMIIVYGLVSAELSSMLLTPRWLLFLGAGSFSLYLIHFAALSFIVKLQMVLRADQWLPLWINWCVAVGFAVGIGVMFHLFVERNLLSMLRRKIYSKKHIAEVM